MQKARAPLLVLLAVIMVGGVDLALHLPRMPARVAVHFDGAGQANGWMSPVQFARFDGLVLGLILVLIVGGGALTRYLPTSMINIPNREYWFAPERRQQSLDRLVRHLLWMGAIIAGLFAAINHLVFRANMQGAPRLSSPGAVALIIVFLAAISAWSIRLVTLFPRFP